MDANLTCRWVPCTIAVPTSDRRERPKACRCDQQRQSRLIAQAPPNNEFYLLWSCIISHLKKGYDTQSFVAMAARLIPTSEAARLTGLPVATFREWTVRRSLIVPDVSPAGKGSSAKFAWQTVLVLRIAALLKNCLHIELQAYQKSFAELRSLLGRTSFVKLWGCQLLCDLDGKWETLGPSKKVVPEDSIVFALDPHLAILRDGFALPRQSGPEQLDLFTLDVLHGEKRQLIKAAAVRRSA